MLEKLFGKKIDRGPYLTKAEALELENQEMKRAIKKVKWLVWSLRSDLKGLKTAERALNKFDERLVDYGVEDVLR